MYDYSEQIEKFHHEKVRLPKTMVDKLTSHRQANEDRLISRLPEKNPGLSISRSRFSSQGSFAMRTIIQTRFDDEEYDIDDGVLLYKSELIDDEGKDLGTEAVAELVVEALKDKRFVKQPKRQTNCVRVFYSEEDKYKHHVDFPIYRTFESKSGEELQELASKSDGWVASNPTQVNVWFKDLIKQRELAQKGAGTQLRRLVRLLKRFCKSRQDWDMPNGLKLTMLVAETAAFRERIDIAFEEMLKALQVRLQTSLEVENLADNNLPRAKLTRSSADTNMVELRDHIDEAREKLSILFEEDCTRVAARAAWDWAFKSDGYFESLDNDDDDDDGGGGGGDGGGRAGTAGIASTTPAKPVDHQGGGRFG